MPRSPLPPFTVRPPCKRCGWPKTPGAIYPGRALQNAFSAEWHGREEELAARQAEVEKEYLATVRDEVSRGAVWAGGASIWSTTSRALLRSSTASLHRRLRSCGKAPAC